MEPPSPLPWQGLKLSFESTLIEVSSTAGSNAGHYPLPPPTPWLSIEHHLGSNKDIWREAFYRRTVEARFAGTHFKRTVFQFARRKTQNISY